jgi:hypothetical protein
MASFLRVLLVATALLSSGVLQVAAAMGDDACCAEEAGGGDASGPDCSPGVACACCPTRGAIEVHPVVAAPAPPIGAAPLAHAPEPSLGASVTDIFHPPRA